MADPFPILTLQPTIRVLSDAQIRALHAAALEILEKTVVNG